MVLRICKIVLVASAGLYLGLITLNNLLDYDSNLQFVRHVLSMEDTFPTNRLMWRAITNPILHHLFYGLIIVWEGLAALLCGVGVYFLCRSFRSDATTFSQSKSIAIGGLALALLLWRLGFLVVGGEWFLMWQSTQWNGQNAAARLFLVFGIILLFLNQSDGN